MDERTKYRVPIGDACVSMRVCFDSLCFSSEPPHADEEDAAAAVPSSQLSPTQGAANVVTVVDSTTTTTQVMQVPYVGAGESVAALKELLRIQEQQIAELRSTIRSRDAEIQELRSHLDKFQSVLPRTRGRAQGISAEPPLQELAPLVIIDKSDK